MFRYIIEIFCKDTTVGLCQLERNKTFRVFKNKYPDILFNSRYISSSFKNSFSIGQTAYHL